MDIKEIIYAYYVSGGGKEYDEGWFVVAGKTEKFLTLKMLREGYFSQYPDWKIRKIPLKDFKRRKEPMPIWWDKDSFTCYHHQSGTPTIYKKLTKGGEYESRTSSKNSKERV